MKVNCEDEAQRGAKRRAGNSLIPFVKRLHEKRSDEFAIFVTNTLAALSAPRYARRSFRSDNESNGTGGGDTNTNTNTTNSETPSLRKRSQSEGSGVGREVLAPEAQSTFGKATGKTILKQGERSSLIIMCLLFCSF